MSTPPNTSFAKLTDQELEDLITEVFRNIEVALGQIQFLWKKPGFPTIQKHYREQIEQGSKDLDALLTVWNYRQESMR